MLICWGWRCTRGQTRHNGQGSFGIAGGEKFGEGVCGDDLAKLEAKSEEKENVEAQRVEVPIRNDTSRF
jgi:hypothetical protein